MRAGRYSIIVGFLVLIAGLAMGSHAPVHPSAFKTDHTDIARGISFGRYQHPAVFQRFTSFIKKGESSDSTRGERRHVKSLVSEAIAADDPLTILPDFTYCHRNYSLFLPGGSTRQFTGNYSLRGPPVC